MPTRRSTRISSRQNSNDLQNGFGRSGNRNLSYDLLPLSTSNTTTVTTITTITPRRVFQARQQQARQRRANLLELVLES